MGHWFFFDLISFLPWNAFGSFFGAYSTDSDHFNWSNHSQAMQSPTRLLTVLVETALPKRI
jgi:hypothetical protein